MRITGEVKFRNHDWNIEAEVMPVMMPPGWLVIVRSITDVEETGKGFAREARDFASLENAIQFAATIVGMQLS